MGGLGIVSFTMSSGIPRWPLGITVHSSNPVIACLGSQYAGWTMQRRGDRLLRARLGAGARALARKEELFKELGYVDHHNKAALVIEGDKAPPPALRQEGRGRLRRRCRPI